MALTKTKKRSRTDSMRLLTTVAFLSVVVWSGESAKSRAAEPSAPVAGSKAADFMLESMDGVKVRLSDEVARGPLVLTVLRGWPGYDCPFCTRQFADYLSHAEAFEQRGARVLFVYPGPVDKLKEHAAGFIASRPMPAPFRVLLDPDYTFTNAYGLRWNAPNETAYPATFVLNERGVVTFASVSRGHGDRVSTEVVLKALAQNP
ncbi:MAG: peroxiredoxin family protein [Acidobacteriota bacterium]